MKGQPFSVRLEVETEMVIEAEARRTGRSKSALVEAFVEETARTRRFPGVGFRGDGVSRRAWVVGTGLDVWEMVQMLQDFETPEALVADTHLSPAQVRLAQAYWKAYPSEIDAAIAENRLTPAELERLYPFIQVAEA